MEFLILNQNNGFPNGFPNQITGFLTPEQQLNNFNIIKKQEEEKKTIYNEHKFIIYKKKVNTNNNPGNRVDFNFKFTFTKPFEDVLSVKLLKASLKINKNNTFNIATGNNANGTSGASATAFHFYVLDINELNDLKSDNSNAINANSTDSGVLNRFENAFALLDLKNVFNNSGDNNSGIGEYAHHYNLQENSENIKYFDPPLNQLKELNIKMYPHNYENIAERGRDTYLLLEFLVKTKDRITIY